MITPLRKNLQSVSYRNQSLQDILSSSTKADKVLDISPFPVGVHNTKITLLLDNKEERVHFYNRIDLKTLLTEELEITSLEETISQLNLLGYDFTEDDLELVDGTLKAKATSLGYIGEVEVKVGVSASPILYHHNLGMFALDVDNDISFDQYYFKLTLGVSGTVIDEVFDLDTMWDDYYWHRNWFPIYWISNAIGDHGANEFEFFSDYNSSPAVVITNLCDEENSLTYEYGRIIDGEHVAIFNRTFNFLPNGERLAPDASLFNAVASIDLDDISLIEETLLSSNVEYYEIEHNGDIFKESPEFRVRYYYDNPILVNILAGDLMYRIGFGDSSTLSISTEYDSINDRDVIGRIYNNTGDYLKLVIKAKLEGVDELLTLIDVELGTIAK